MTQRAFSLVEISVAMAIGMVVLGFLFQAHQVAARQERILDQSTRTETELNLAAAEIRATTRGLDHGFWIEFPRSLPLVHPVDHLHGALQFSASCPQHSGSACFTSFDLVPRREQPWIYRTIASDYPRVVRLSALNGYAGDELPIRAGDVLYFTSEANSFCAVVGEALVDQIELAPGRAQPWALPDTLEPDCRIVNLGALVVRHLYLENAGGSGQQLMLEPWTLGPDGWQAGRRGSSHGGIEHLLFQPCDAEQGDRLFLVAQMPNAGRLAEPLELAGQVFSQEVAYATLEF